MSFEGYDQFICKNGHTFQLDAHETMYSDDPFGNIECSVCNAKAIWRNGVDLTNGSWDDDGNRIDGYIKLEIKTPSVHCQCATCGDKHIKTPETYRVPEEGVGHRI